MTQSATVTMRISRGLREAVAEFQRYVVAQHACHARRWPAGRELAQEAAVELARAVRGESEAIDPLAVGRLLRAQFEFRDEIQLGASGRITPTETGFRAVVAGVPEWPRTRFTVAHECGHVLFYHPILESRQRPERIVPAGAGIGGDGTKREEGLCDDFARALLLPNEGGVRKILSTEGRADELVLFARTYGVSPSVLVRRVLYDLRGWEGAVFYYVGFWGRDVRCRRYWGSGRRANVKSLPTADDLRKIIRGRSLEGAAEILQEEFKRRRSMSQVSIASMGSTIWVRA